MGRATLIAAIITIVAITAAAYYALHHVKLTTQTPARETTHTTTTTVTESATSPEAATTTTVRRGASTQPATGRGPGARGANGGSQGAAIQPEVASACKDAGLVDEPIGRVINWLFDHHSEFRYRLYVYPENRTIIWVITGPSREALEMLVTHIEQMKCVIEHGGNPRPFDPLFQVDAEITKEYVETRILWVNDTTVKIIKHAENDCAFLVIKLHAEVVKGFFDTDRLEAQKTHEVPPEALEVCKEYLKG